MILILTGFTFLIEPPVALMEHQEEMLAPESQGGEKPVRSLSLSIKSVEPFSSFHKHLARLG